jgi:endoglucanase
MKTVIKVSALLLLLPLVFSGSCTSDGGGSGSEVVLDDSYYTDLYDYDNTDTFLGRGINMGNYLEAPVDVDGDGVFEPAQGEYELGEGGWTGGQTIQQGDFAIIAAAGFKTVRIPVRWSDHAGADTPYTVDPAFMTRVETVVGWALDAGLNVVLNTHHYVEMMDDDAAALPGHEARLHAIWGQICDNFDTTDYPVDRVVFELLNEPNGTVGYDEWNGILADLTTLIWTTKGQSTRKIMIGTANWGGPTGLENLDLPVACTSSNTIITIHWYEPFQFTHQGAEWVSGSDAWIGTTWTGTETEQEPLLTLLDSVTDWNTDPDRGFEIFMGEFGVYTKHADPAHQQAWTAFIAREAEARDMSWAYWEYDSGFGAYDSAENNWHAALIDALVPVTDRP